jgi:hypothetical protein
MKWIELLKGIQLNIYMEKKVEKTCFFLSPLKYFSVMGKNGT